MHLVRPETLRHLQANHSLAAPEFDNLASVLDRSTVDDGLLALCSDYFEAKLREKDWAAPSPTNELETACLNLCAQFMLSVANVSDDHIDALSRHLNADEVYNLMYAIYLIEASKRLELTLEGMLQ